MRYWTSDLHLGHTNIVRFCHRPYWAESQPGEQVPDVDAMNNDLIDQINDTVGTGDELWLLGDVAMGKLADTLPLLNRLHAGRIVLVAGNHDRIHPSNKKPEKFQDAYNAVFDHIITTNTDTLLFSGRNVQVSHFPYTLSPTESRADEPHDRFAPWRPVDDGRWLLCGHVHDAWAMSPRQLNVGWDAWGTPLSDDTVESLITDYIRLDDALASSTVLSVRSQPSERTRRTPDA